MNRIKNNNKGFSAARVATDGVLLGLALIIFIVELAIPPLTPIPGIKAGLSNVITLFSMFTIGPVDTLIILILRIILGNIFSGNAFAMVYSFAGGILCYLTVLLLKKILTKDQIWVAGVFGAVVHNIGQILTAVLITKTPAIFSYLPVLIVSGIITGLFTGLIATMSVKKVTLFK